MDRLGNYWAYSICGAAFCICFATAGVSIFTAIAFLIGFYVMYHERNFDSLTDNPIAKRIVFFWLCLFASSLFSIHIGESIKDIWSSYFNCLLPFFLILYMGRYVKKEKLQWLIWAGFGSMVVTTIACLWQYANGDPRPIGLSGHWMFLGGYYSLYIPLFVLVLMDGSILHTKRQKVIMWTMALFCCAGFLANNTRGAWLAAAIAIAVIVALIGRHNKKMWGIGACIAILCAGLLVTIPLLNARVHSTIKGIQTMADSDASHATDQRWFIWRGAVAMFQDKPITGHGLGSFMEVYNSQYKAANNPEWNVDYSHAHNMYLHIASEAGVIGLTGLLVLYLYTLYVGGKIYLRQGSIYGLFIIAIMLSMMLHGLTEWNGRIFRISWMLIAWAYVMAEKDGAIRKLEQG